MVSSMKDFGKDAPDIQTAMVQHVVAHPDRDTRTGYILWNGREVWTSHAVQVPKSGKFRIDFLSDARDPPQGVDVRAEGGKISLDGEVVETLRTWHDDRYEESVVYAFQSPSGLLLLWNVYTCKWPGGRNTEEKWTGNAGFSVEPQPDGAIVFRCSPGQIDEPDFEQLVFRFSIVQN